MTSLMTLNEHKNRKLRHVIACLKSDRIPGSRLLIPSLPSLALRMHVESLGKPRDVNMGLVNLISNDTRLGVVRTMQ